MDAGARPASAEPQEFEVDKEVSMEDPPTSKAGQPSSQRGAKRSSESTDATRAVAKSKPNEPQGLKRGREWSEEEFASVIAAIEELQDSHEADATSESAPIPEYLLERGRAREFKYFQVLDTHERVKVDTLPPGTRVIPTGWVNKMKGDEALCRLVAREIAKKQGPRTDLFAATPSAVGNKVLTVIAVVEEEDMSSGDFDVGFLHAPTDEDIYVKPPPEANEPPDIVWRCKKAMNGLRKAPKWFQEWLVGLMTKKLGFIATAVYPMVLYGPGERNNRLKVSIHVDDPWIVGKPEKIKKFFEDLKKEAFFREGEILEEGCELKHLSQGYRKTAKGYVIRSYESYNDDTAKLAGMAGCKPVSTPGVMAPSKEELLANEKEATSEESYLVDSVVRRVQYQSEDRSDVHYPLKELSREMGKATKGTVMRAKRLVRYLAGKKYVEYRYPWGDMPKTLDVYVDSDWAKCSGTRKSTSAGHIRCGPYHLKNFVKTQSVIALLSAEAELYAIVTGLTEAILIQNLFLELGYDLEIVVHSDSAAGRAMCRRSGVGKVKHLHIKVLWVQQKLQNKEFLLECVSGKENPADLGTKNHGTEEHDYLCGLNGMHFRPWEQEDEQDDICVIDYDDMAVGFVNSTTPLAVPVVQTEIVNLLYMEDEQGGYQWVVSMPLLFWLLQLFMNIVDLIKLCNMVYQKMKSWCSRGGAAGEAETPNTNQQTEAPVEGTNRNMREVNSQQMLNSLFCGFQNNVSLEQTVVPANTNITRLHVYPAHTDRVTVKAICCAMCGMCEVVAEKRDGRTVGTQSQRTFKRHYATPKDVALGQNEHWVCDASGLWINEP